MHLLKVETGTPVLRMAPATDETRHNQTEKHLSTMNEILAQLIAAAIDPDKIPGLDYFDMTLRPAGKFEIVLNDTTRLRITVDDVSESMGKSEA